jgi:glutaminyl-tRNA synthetase
MDTEKKSDESVHFIRQIIDTDRAVNGYDSIKTRFPPEPNGYLHIGHAKSICLNFGLSKLYPGATCNLRFDDTNPEKEEEEYENSIKEDVKWLGFDWEDRLYHSSDYFEQLYGFAQQLIRDGKAYVCSLNLEQIRATRGTVKEPGENSPDRERPIEESLDLFERMRHGEFEDGAYTLRAKIDMAHPNMKMRDPLMYRIRHAEHHRTGNEWKIYPMYDWAHGLSDAIEGITHSICTLEFEVNRPLYDWFIEAVRGISRPKQIEFARLNLEYTVMSKRKLLQLVTEKHVSGWNDPRMPTIAGMRRRGYTPQGIRTFCDMIGVSKVDSVITYDQFTYAVREDLNKVAQRVMAVLDPVKLIIDNYPEDKTEEFETENNPENEADGTRLVPFSRELYIERSDFMEDPPKKFFRLGIGREVRLKGAYFVTCTSVDKDEAGEITALHCTYDPASQGGNSPDGRKVKGTIHWVSAAHAIDAELRNYEHLFTSANPADESDGVSFLEKINPDSLEVVTHAKLEPSLKLAKPGESFQFMRQGYYCADSVDCTPDHLVFNRTIGLRDSWGKQQK